MKALLTATAIFSAALISSCSAVQKENYIKNSSESASADPGNVTRLEVSQCVGKCTISYGDTDQVIMNTNCRFSGIRSNKVNEAYENTALSYEIRDDELYVCFIDSSTGKEIGSQETSFTKIVNVNTDIEIILPESFSDFKIACDVGDVEMSGISGKFDISADVGDIDLMDISLTGDSVIRTDVGNIEVSLSAVEKSALEISTDVGNIELDTQGMNYSEISGSDNIVAQEKEILIDQKCTAVLKADVGNAEVKR